MYSRKNRIWIILVWLCALLVTSCSVTKYIPEGETLYTGSTIHIKDHKAGKQEREFLKTDLGGAVRPIPNKKMLGLIRFKLWAYYVSTKDSSGNSKKLLRWLHKKGEPPVYFSSFNVNHNRSVLANRLYNRGFFYAHVDATPKTKGKKTEVSFDVVTNDQYKIRNVVFNTDTSQLAKDIDTIKEETLLTKGQPYNLDLIKGERERIDKKLKERGYFYFKPDYLLVTVDSSVGDHQVDLQVRVKEDEMPDEAVKIFHIKDVYIYPNYRLGAQKADTNLKNAVFYKGFYVVEKSQDFKPSVFTNAMKFEPGDLYSRTDHDASLSRLVSLGTFKFVKNRFQEVDTTIPALNVFYYLTPFQKKSIRLEAGANTQNDSRVGSKISVTWRNKNAFRGAELFQVKVFGGFEMQYISNAENSTPNTYQAGVETSVSFPRFMVPFVNINSTSFYMPHTVIKAGYTLETQSQPLRVHTAKAAFGYDWKEDVRKQHQLYPINVYFVRTDTIDNGANFDYTYNYSNIDFNGFVIGPSYEFTYNSQAQTVRKSNFYFDGLADFSGTLSGFTNRAQYGDEPKKIVNSALAEYIRAQLDFRYYNNLDNKTAWASRFVIGAGRPYGQSYQLPNVKQFFSGGSSSLRGFRSRMVGPGTFNSEGTDYIQMVGDLKLEFSTELRRTLYNFVKGAVFFDAGNIWLYNKNPDFPGGEFTKDFYKQFAADVGLGLRFDFKILILRLDWGMPIRKPWLPEGERWVFNKIDLGDPDWRKNNMLLNIAIGYPF